MGKEEVVENGQETKLIKMAAANETVALAVSTWSWYKPHGGYLHPTHCRISPYILNLPRD